MAIFLQTAFVLLAALVLSSCSKTGSPTEPTPTPAVVTSQEPVPTPDHLAVELAFTDPSVGSTLKASVENGQGYLVGDFLKVHLRFTLTQALIDEAKRNSENIVLITYLSVDGESELPGALSVKSTSEARSGITEHRMTVLRSISDARETNFILYKMEFRKDNRPRAEPPIFTGKFPAKFHWQ